MSGRKTPSYLLTYFSLLATAVVVLPTICNEYPNLFRYCYCDDDDYGTVSDLQSWLDKLLDFETHEVVETRVEAVQRPVHSDGHLRLVHAVDQRRQTCSMRVETVSCGRQENDADSVITIMHTEST